MLQTALPIDCWGQAKELFGSRWFQNGILIATACVGLTTLYSSKRQERRRATVDVLLETVTNPRFRETRIKVRALIKKGLDPAHLQSDAGLEDRLFILSILSFYEYMAAGVHEDAFDAKLYQRMYQYMVISDWDELKSFVFDYRALSNPTVLQEVEELVKQWMDHPLPLYRDENGRRNTRLRRALAWIAGIYGQGSNWFQGSIVWLRNTARRLIARR